MHIIAGAGSCSRWTLRSHTPSSSNIYAGDLWRVQVINPTVLKHQFSLIARARALSGVLSPQSLLYKIVCEGLLHQSNHVGRRASGDSGTVDAEKTLFSRLGPNRAVAPVPQGRPSSRKVGSPDLGGGMGQISAMRPSPCEWLRCE